MEFKRTIIDRLNCAITDGNDPSSFSNASSPSTRSFSKHSKNSNCSNYNSNDSDSIAEKESILNKQQRMNRKNNLTDWLISKDDGDSTTGVTISKSATKSATSTKRESLISTSMSETCPTKLSALTLNDLVEICKRLNLPHSGTKSKLVNNIVARNCKLPSGKSGSETIISSKSLKNKCKTSKLLDSVNVPYQIVDGKKLDGSLVHDRASNFVFDVKSNMVVGKNESIDELDVEDVEICKSKGFSFKMPLMLNE